MAAKTFQFTDKEKKAASNIVKKANEYYKTDAPIISFDNLFEILQSEEIALVKRIMSVDPKEFGFNGPEFGCLEMPQEIVALDHNGEEIPGEIDKNTVKYLPREVFDAFSRMNHAIKTDIGKRLVITSGYRSPAYQAVTFFYYLIQHKFDFDRTAKGVAIPGYSEHGCPERQAIDFMTVEGISGDNKVDEFPKTEEYKWLIANANRFGFYLSYPEGNKEGVIFEPYHWHYEAQSH